MIVQALIHINSAFDILKTFSQRGPTDQQNQNPWLWTSWVHNVDLYSSSPSRLDRCWTQRMCETNNGWEWKVEREREWKQGWSVGIKVSLQLEEKMELSAVLHAVRACWQFLVSDQGRTHWRDVTDITVNDYRGVQLSKINNSNEH